MSKLSGPVGVFVGTNTAATNAIQLYKAGSDQTNPTINLSIAGAANASSTTYPTIVNASFAEACTLTIPDPGVSAANFVLSSGGALQSVAVTLNTAQVTGAYATPVVLIPAPGAGMVALIQEFSLYTASTGNTAYASGGVGVIQYGNTAHGAGTNALSGTIAATNITAAASQIITGLPSTTALTGVSNAGIYFSNQTGAFTNGTGTNLTFYITYQIIAAAV